MRSHAGTPSAPVAFLGFRCFSIAFTCPILGKGGGRSSSPSAISLTVDAVASRPSQGAVNASNSLSATAFNSAFVGALRVADCFSAPQRVIWGYTGIHGDTQGYIGTHWDTQGYTGTHWDTQGCSISFFDCNFLPVMRMHCFM